MPTFGSIIGVGVPGETGPAGPTGPTGPQGPTGPAGPSAPLSDATPATLGSAAAGASTDASRADHVHALPSALAVGAQPRASRTLAGVSGSSASTDAELAVPEVFTLTLHSAASSAGQRLTITCSGGGRLARLVLVPASGEAINDLSADATAVAIDARSVELVSDGSRWVSASVRGFEFADIPSLMNDWDPSDASCVEIGESNSVTVLRDKISGLSLLGPATVSQRPTLRRRAYECNGKPALNFYATNSQRLTAAAVAGNEMHSGAGSTTVVYVVPQSMGTTVVLDEFGTTTANGNGQQIASVNGAIAYYVSRTGSVATSLSSATYAQGRGITAVARLRATNTTGSLRTTFEGTTTTVSATWSTPTYGAPAYPLSLGAYANGGAGHLQGLVARVLRWRRELSDAECAQVEAKLESLYRSTAPTATTAPVASALSGTVTVMYVGDSITEGNTGADVGQKGGFRKRIADTITGITLDAIGPSSYGDFADNQHHGQSGWAIRPNGGSNNTHFPGSQDRANSPGSLDKVLLTYVPQVMVLNIGVNDLSGTDATIFAYDRVGDLVEMCADAWARTSMRLVLCTITPADTGTSSRHQKHAAFRAALGPAVAELRRRGVPVAVADTWSSITPNATYLSDGLHLTTTGYNAAADAIIPAIKYAAGLS